MGNHSSHRNLINNKSCGQEKTEAELNVHTALYDILGIKICVPLVAIEEPGGRKVSLEQTPAISDTGLLILICEFIKWALGEQTVASL